MKPFLKLLFGFLFFIPFYIQANHLAGGELTYTCIGNNQYIIHYVYYRDCNGIQPEDTLKILVENTCGLPIDTINAYKETNPPLIIAYGCPGYPNSCSGGNLPAVQKINYEGIATLNGTCLWNLSYSSATRNVPYVNPEPFYINTTINTSGSVCDTSPVFTNDPFIFLCLGKDTCDDPGLFDAEGDSLVCELVDPLTSANTTLTYNAGFSLTYPMVSIPPLFIDHNSGSICCNPQQLDLTTIAFVVSSYRNGTLLGQVKRDILYYNILCANYSPQISGINGTNSDSLSACVGELICFKIHSYDQDSYDSTFLSWSHNLGTASFVVDTLRKQSAEFCWATTPADIDTIPHCFAVSVVDNNCYGALTTLRNFCITIHDSDNTCIYLNQSQIQKEKSVLIYPQPAMGEIHIDFQEDFQNTYFLEIYNVLGKTVYTSELKERNNVLYLNEEISSGIYFVNLVNRNIKTDIIRKMIVVD